MATRTREVNGSKEFDACGIFARVEKSARATRTSIQSGMEALRILKHRGGFVDGEGDGCGLLLDIPKALWRRWLLEAGQRSELVQHPGFFVAHLMIRPDSYGASKKVIHSLMRRFGMSCIHWRNQILENPALGPMARKDVPVFVQLAGIMKDHDEAHLFRCALAMEHRGVHVLSMSQTSVVYKVIGDAHTLWDTFEDLRDPQCTSSFVLAHTRFSTNTATEFSRVQPFATLGHNGEINTISRFARESEMLGIPLPPNCSDSQMLDWGLRGIMSRFGLTLFETMEMLFPPILHEMKKMPTSMRAMYQHYRAAWGPFCQGPAAVIVKAGQEAVFSVDALGLRPLWHIETADAHCFSSEQGVVPVEAWITDPIPLSPGEKMGIEWKRGRVTVYPYERFCHEVLRRFQVRQPICSTRIVAPGGGEAAPHILPPTGGAIPVSIRAAAHGWRSDDVKVLEHAVKTGLEPIHSLGYDGPLAALCRNNRLLSDFLHESVAVVTNPAIDREREIEHFSTRVVLGNRPSLHSTRPTVWVELESPLLLEKGSYMDGDPDEISSMARRHGDWCIEDVLATLHSTPADTAELNVSRLESESLQDALQRLAHESVEAVKGGAHLIVLDDRLQFSKQGAMDIFVALRAVHLALCRPAGRHACEHLRRRVGIVVRSAGIRNLHDVMVALGLGADAVCPRMMWELAQERGGHVGVENTYLALRKGIEKVLSTLGVHELRGYERLFAAIGLTAELAEFIGVPHFCGSRRIGYGWRNAEEDACEREQLYAEADPRTLNRQREFRLIPKVWKLGGQAAESYEGYATYCAALANHEAENPVQIRNALSFATENSEPDGFGISQFGGAFESADTRVGGHRYPFVISSMSFGSQGETAYRAYLEAAHRLNIVAMNGEGGEIKDLLGKYPHNRGRQIASGRFGVNAELCNQAYVLEIKIGQGAKPGEGGHLPGSKVTALVASARNAAIGIDLISPSNNHDIYSIEDLAQVIHELKEVNPQARVSVKVPVVPNIGTIAVGIVKAGADIVALSGYDGGTGAARAHAIRFVGLPVEIGIVQVHDALCASGLRNRVEIWADGGMKSGADVVKAILLGANRVGFGTMAMVAVGCTGCRACHKDTCHVGIATQMQTIEEAMQKGLPAFAPRELGPSVDRLVRFFTAMGQHVSDITRKLGVERTQDLVGRRHLLRQMALFDRLDLTAMTQQAVEYAGMGTQVEWQPSRHELVYASQSEQAEAVNGSSNHAEVAWDGSTVSLVQSDFTWESGRRVRLGSHASVESAEVRQHPSGCGLAAYQSAGMYGIVVGGAQDGVSKTAYGGKTVILKHRTSNGDWVGGSVGKSLAYGAQHGLVIVQGNADSRAGVRLSGADVIIGGEATEGASEHWRWAGRQANIKGFAFEYMTAGRALVLGDSGPWMCSGMTGGSVYVRHMPARGLTEEALRSRLAKGAKVHLSILDAAGERDVVELLLAYHKELRRHGQSATARGLLPLLMHPREHFRMIRPGDHQTDQSIATE